MMTKKEALATFKRLIKDRFGITRKSQMLTTYDGKETKTLGGWLVDLEQELDDWRALSATLVERKQNYDTMCLVFCLYFGIEY